MVGYQKIWRYGRSITSHKLVQLKSLLHQYLPFPKHDSEIGKSFVIFVLHIPKTAGTSLRHDFNLCTKTQPLVYPSQSDLKSLGGSYPSFVEFQKIYPALRQQGKAIFFGHYSLRQIESLQSDVPIHMITVLRSPFERLLSHIRHEHSRANFPDTKITDFISASKNKYNNIQYRYLFGNRNINQLEANEILSQVKLLGFTENYPQFVRQLNNRYQLDLKPKSRSNTKKSMINFETIQEIQAVQTLINLDYFLYNYCMCQPQG